MAAIDLESETSESKLKNAELHKFFSTYGNILLKKSQDYTEKYTNLGTV